MKIIHFTSDLMLGSQVSQVARGRGIGVEMIQRLDRLFERVDETTAMIILDLQCAQWSADSFRLGRSAGKDLPRIVAYAQHVLGEVLTEAMGLGLESVMTRGQFVSSLGALLNSISPLDADA